MPDPPSTELHVLRVFCDRDGRAGNPLGVFPNAPVLVSAVRQRIAGELGFSETVFLEDHRSGTLRIHTPARELPFAGHPMVGTAWLLGNRPDPPAALRPPAGAVRYGAEDDRAWVIAGASDAPHWELQELPDEASLLALETRPGHVLAWTYRDPAAGVVRARVFASDYGVPEDPATGSAAIVLAVALERELRILQGPAGSESEIEVSPLGAGQARLGGRVVVDRPPQGYPLAAAQ